MNSVVNTNNAPKAIGPYSQAIKTDKCLFISGCLGIEPSTGELAKDIEGQAKQAMDNLVAILNEAGLTTDDIVKTICFMSDLNNFAAFNEIYATYFKEGHYPARSCVEVSKLPKGGLIEIEAIASL